MLGLWTALLSAGDLPEGWTELAFHLISETLMALGCLVSGILVLRGAPVAAAANAAAHAAVIYSTLNAAGYYGERENPAAAVTMTGLALLSGLIVAAQLARLRRHR